MKASSVLAIASGVGLFVLFSQSWSPVMHSILSLNEPQFPQSSGTLRVTAPQVGNADQEEELEVLGDP